MSAASNPVVYFEIPVSNVSRAMQFYQTVFGFSFNQEQVDGNEMALFPFADGHSGISGALAKGKTYRPSTTGTLVYFYTEDIEQTLHKVQRAGGQILYPKTDIGALGYVAEFKDSEGNRVALYAKRP